MDEQNVRRVNSIQQHILRIFPVTNARRYKSDRVNGMYKFLDQVLVSDPRGRYNEGSGDVDAKAFGTLFHDQVAAWTSWTPSKAFSTIESFIASCLPQVQQLIAFFQSKGYVGIASNIVIYDALLNYATPVDILLVPTKNINNRAMDFAFLVELKTTHTLKRERARACLYPISKHLPYETPETFASLQAVLPTIRMNEVIAQDDTLRALNIKLRMMPLVVVVRMDSQQQVLSIEEETVPIDMQSVAFRNELHEYLPKMRIETGGKIKKKKRYFFICFRGVLLCFNEDALFSSCCAL